MPAPCRACGKLTNEKQPNCIYCGTLLVPPVPCSGCKREVPAHFAKCMYCGTPSTPLGASAPVPVPPPAVVTAPQVQANPAPLPPRPSSLKAPPSPARRIARIVFLSCILLAIAGALWHYRSVKAMWPCLATITWFVLASTSFTSRERTIARVGFIGRDAEIHTTVTSVDFRTAAIKVGISALLWLVIYVWAFKGAFWLSQYGFWIGLFLFASSLFTNYKFKETRARVMDPSLEQHISEFGLPVAVVRQYYIWGLLPPFIHAAFRLML